MVDKVIQGCLLDVERNALNGPEKPKNSDGRELRPKDWNLLSQNRSNNYVDVINGPNQVIRRVLFIGSIRYNNIGGLLLWHPQKGGK